MREVTTNKPWLSGHRDRRQSPRLVCRGLVTADLQRSGKHLTVKDLSLAGFTVETPMHFDLDTLHHCSLHPDDGRAITMLVQVARSERVHGAPYFVTAFKFSLYEADGRDRLNELMTRFARRAGFDQAAG
jgi:hypothetical protein